MLSLTYLVIPPPGAVLPGVPGDQGVLQGWLHRRGGAGEHQDRAGIQWAAEGDQAVSIF